MDEIQEKDNKKRANNFSQIEIELLQELVKKYWKILENKKSDRCTWKQKNECWNRLADEFNSSSDTLQVRKPEILHRKWENIKKNVKQKVTKEKCHVKGTGGGPAIYTTLNENENEILSLLNVQVTGHDAEFDCDVPIDIENTNKTREDIFDFEVDSTGQLKAIEDDFTTKSSISWDDYTPEMLKTPVSKSLIVTPSPLLLETPSNDDKNIGTTETNKGLSIPTSSKKKKRSSEKITNTTTNKKWCIVADKKLAIYDLQIAQMAEEHSLKLSLIKKEYEKKMEILEAEHALKMEILRKELSLK